MELKSLARLLHPRHQVYQVHWGGGTPTFMRPDQIRRLGNMLSYYLNIRENVEYGVEIDPRSFSDEILEALLEAGMNRASVGVQDINEEVQKAIHRIQPFDMVHGVVKSLRAAGIRSVNVDLVYGLPKQTRERFSQTLDALETLDPDRIAIYSYAHVPWLKPAQKLLETCGLPGPDEKLALLHDAIDRMQHLGYDHIGMDHFARPNDELSIALRDGALQRNFQGYSTLSGLDIYGLGMSSISSVGKFYFQNEKGLDEWYDRVSNDGDAWVRGVKLTDDDEIRRWVIMKIMCSQHLNFREVWERWYINPTEYFRKDLIALKPFEQDRILEISPEGVRILPGGRHFLRNISMAFDIYLQTKSKKPVFSKTI